MTRLHFFLKVLFFCASATAWADGGFVLPPAYPHRQVKLSCATQEKDKNSCPPVKPKEQKTVTELSNLYKTSLYQAFYRALDAKGFPKSTIPRLFCVAYLESGLNPKALNQNKNGTVDVGLFQINSQWRGKCGDPGRSLAANLDCAKVVLDQQGLNAWTTYKQEGWVCEKSI